MRQWTGFERREEVNRTVADRHGRGESIKAIVRTSGLSRQTVRRILRGTRDDIFRTRESSLDRWVDRIETEWNGGCRKGAELWRRLKAAGLWRQSAGRHGMDDAQAQSDSFSAPASLGRIAVPSSRIMAHLLTCERDARSAEALRIRVAVKTACPALVAARTILDRFKTMVASGKAGDLDPWLADAVGTEMLSFSNGISADRAAVSAAITEPWSNRQTEGGASQGPLSAKQVRVASGGQVTRLKLVKRQMYGRAKVDLLRARLVPAA